MEENLELSHRGERPRIGTDWWNKSGPILCVKRKKLLFGTQYWKNSTIIHNTFLSVYTTLSTCSLSFLPCNQGWGVFFQHKGHIPFGTILWGPYVSGEAKLGHTHPSIPLSPHLGKNYWSSRMHFSQPKALRMQNRSATWVVAERCSLGKIPRAR